MSAMTGSPLLLPPAERVYRITVEQYERMVAAGAIGEHERVELLGGVLVRKMTINPEHEWAASEIWDALLACRAAGWHVRKKAPVRLGGYDEPEPDLAVVRGTRASLRGRHPGPADLALVIEVANTSLEADRGVRLERYARAGIPVYWIVNLPAGRVEVYTLPDPAAGRYGARRDHAAEELVPILIDGQEVCRIAVADLLP